MLWLVDPDHPPRQQRPAQPRQEQGRRAPGVVGLGRRPSSPRSTSIPARRRPRLDQTARLAGLPRRAVPARPPRSPLPDDAARVRRSAGLSSRAPRTRIRSISRPARSGWARSRRSLPRWPHATPSAHFGAVTSDRFVALIGDAELDEGNVWETVAEEAIQGLGNVIWIIDLNRQSLDRVIPGVRAARLKALFAGAGWKVLEAKYGSRLEAAMSEPGGDALRRRIDDMSNEEYQALIRLRDGAELRRRLADVPDADGGAGRSCSRSPAIAGRGPAASWSPTSAATTCRACSRCWPRPTPSRTRRSSSSPTPSRALGCRSPATRSTTRMLLTQSQMDELRVHLGVPEDDVWAAFPPDSPEGTPVRRARRGVLARRRRWSRRRCPASVIPESLGATPPGGDLDAGGAGPGAGAAGGCAGGGRAGRDPLAGRRDLDPPGGLDQQGRRLRARGVGGLRGGRAADAALAAGSGGPPHRARHLRDEPLHGAGAVRSLLRADRPAPDPDRHRLRPVRLPRSRRPHLQPLRRGQDDLRRHARRASRCRRRAAPTRAP